MPNSSLDLHVWLIRFLVLITFCVICHVEIFRVLYGNSLIFKCDVGSPEANDEILLSTHKKQYYYLQSALYLL